MTKVIAYITAREQGMTDTEAAHTAGYERGSPSSARDMYALFEVLREEKNDWGSGPRSIKAMIAAWQDEQEAIRKDAEVVHARLKEKRGRINDIERRLRMAEMVLRSKDDAPPGQ